MFNVIRIPTKFSRPIKRLSDKEKLKLLDALINVWDWIVVQQTDDTVWDLLSLIYWEWMNMESKNGHKKDTEYVVTTTPSDPPSMSDCRVEENRIEYNRREEIVATQPNEYQISISYLKNIETEQIPDYAENYQEEWIKFCYYWSEKWKTWKIRAEWEKTFEIKRRFATWMSRKKETYQKTEKPSVMDIVL